jgi:hypothetical protein
MREVINPALYRSLWIDLKTRNRNRAKTIERIKARRLDITVVSWMFKAYKDTTGYIPIRRTWKGNVFTFFIQAHHTASGNYTPINWEDQE